MLCFLLPQLCRHCCCACITLRKIDLAIKRLHSNLKITCQVRKKAFTLCVDRLWGKSMRENVLPCCLVSSLKTACIKTQIAIILTLQTVSQRFFFFYVEKKSNFLSMFGGLAELLYFKRCRLRQRLSLIL